MTAGHKDLDALTAWVSRNPRRCRDIPGLAELVQAVELAETVAGEEGLDWLEGRITGEATVDLDPFDPELRQALGDMVDGASDKILGHLYRDEHLEAVESLRRRWRKP